MGLFVFLSWVLLCFCLEAGGTKDWGHGWPGLVPQVISLLLHASLSRQQRKCPVEFMTGGKYSLLGSNGRQKYSGCYTKCSCPVTKYSQPTPTFFNVFSFFLLEMSFCATPRISSAKSPCYPHSRLPLNFFFPPFRKHLVRGRATRACTPLFWSAPRE